MIRYRLERPFSSATRGWPRLGRDNRGVAALELAFVLPVALVLLLGILEISLECWTEELLDAAVESASRQIQIGAVTTSPAFISYACNTASALVFSCPTSLQVYVTSGTSFSALTAATISGSTMSPATFSPGGGASDVLVQVAYARPFAFSLLASVFGSPSTLLVSSVAFQNEPF